MYAFIFVIAAFGVVWYGIALYGCFLLAIIISISRANEGDTQEEEHIVKATTVLVVVGIITIYLFRSAIPHAWTNISGAGFEEFKNSNLTQDEAIFAYHSDYLNILATLNQKDPGFILNMVNTNSSTNLKKLLDGKVTSTTKAYDFNAMMKQIETINAADVTGISTTDLIALKTDARKLRLELYKKILYPAVADRNEAPIYRIGTFLTYFITDSKFRYFDDSLVQNFYTYFYDEDRNTTVDRISKSGLKYFLVDLNAATIDRDPRHNLTTRYESLLNTFPAKKLQLIQTDSICLRVALDELQAGNIKDEDYKFLAGVNHESYGKTAE